MEENNQNQTQQSAQSPIPEQPSTTSLTVQNKRKLKLPIIFAAVVLFLFLTGAVSAAYLFVFKPKPTPEQLTTKTQQPSPTSDPMANWKTYSNMKYKYSLKYPLTWVEAFPASDSSSSLISSEAEIVTLTSNVRFSDEAHGNPPYDILISYYPNPQKEAFPQIVFNYNHISLADQKKIKFSTENISGTQRYRTNTLPSQLGNETVFIQKKDGTLISISLSPYALDRPFDHQAEQHKIYDQILSTFKFTDNPTANGQTIDTSTWKTYNGNEFTVKYPTNLKTQEINGTENYTSFTDSSEMTNNSTCTNIQVARYVKNTEEMKNWLKSNLLLTQSGTSIVIPREYFPYTNNLNSTINGFWVESGSEVINKNIFVQQQNKYIEFSISGCAAGDSYKDHPEALRIVENMIQTFKFTK